MSIVPYTSAANWPIDTVAYYAVDYDGGSDANLGFSLVSMAAADAAPMKTLTELSRRLPRYGQGRKVVVAIKPRAGGATYRTPDGLADDDLNLKGYGGYWFPLVRGTTDFSNSATDKIVLGAQQAQVGPGAGGVWTVAAGATATTFSVSAGALTAEPALIGKRVRFTGNVTAALANQCRSIWQNTGTAITVLNDTSVAPAAGDTFTIEEPGVRVGRVILETGWNSSLAFSPSTAWVLAGIASTGVVAGTSFTCSGGPESLQIAFCESAAQGRFNGFNFLQIFSGYTDETSTSIAVGCGMRVATSFAFLRGFSAFATHIAAIGSGSSLTNIPTYNINGYSGGGFAILDCPAPAPNPAGSSSAIIGNGGTATTRRFRSVASGSVGGATENLMIRSANCHVRGVDLTAAGGNPALRVRGAGCMVAIDDAVGTTSNTDVGIDVSGAYTSTILCGLLAANTVSGTAGDIRVAGPAITTHAGLLITNVIDNQANDVIGTAGAVVGGQPRLVSNQSGGALAIGKIVRSNAVSGQVTSAQADTEAHATGVLGVLITPPASGAAGYVAPSGPAWVQLDGAGTVGNLCYLSEATAGNGKSVPPAAGPPNQKLRLGYIQETSGTLGLLVPFAAEKVPINSDNLAP